MFVVEDEERARPVAVLKSGRVAGPAAALSATTLLAGCIFTLAVLALPVLARVYRAPSLDVMLETSCALVALFVGYLVLGRFRQNHRLQTLLLGTALSTVAAANLVLTGLPSALRGGTELGTGSPTAVRTLGAVLFFAAAVTSLTTRVDRTRAILVAAGIGGLGVATAVAEVLRGGVLQPALGDAENGWWLYGGLPAPVMAQVVAAVLFGFAAVAFTMQADLTGDRLLRWVAAGCVLSSLARLHYLMSPPLQSGHVYSGDLLRLGGYLLMLVGGTLEVRSYWELRAEAAVVEDRRRMARDLHDGLTQELSYIWAQAQRLAGNPGDHSAALHIRGAADRAIDESRHAIAALTRPHEGSIGEAVEELAEELARRYEVKIVLSGRPDTHVDDALADAILRITGEAIRNAVRHGGASRIDIALATGPLRLGVSDNGCGFAPDEDTSGGFGLTSMRERAASVGGSLVIESAPGEGTTVRLAWT